ncbi:MAG TPA: hypothetical protein VFS43_34615 [Polyangiaceae bacterium]|nr:hypothetical protein [Polyangiaceae bacterium]
MSSPTPEYYRGDQADGITPPNLADTSTYAQHIVHARGKRTRYTSISTDPASITDFGTQLWRVLRPKLDEENHSIEHHDALLRVLLDQAHTAADKAARQIAREAHRRAQRRREALICWNFDVSGVARKDLQAWAQRHVRPYFARV